MSIHAVTLEEAMARLEAAQGERSVALFRHGTLVVKMYAPRGTDPQTPHSRDEIYVVAGGTGDFTSGATSVRFSKGDLLFAPAGVEHRFENFSDDFAVWVLFYGPEGGESD
ncbi:MAG TPA: cupin domain-containing protein [Blastocatellia bacterium]|nr:cupin domain-containing protein [Blastocatellia bacterium]